METDICPSICIVSICYIYFIQTKNFETSNQASTRLERNRIPLVPDRKVRQIASPHPGPLARARCGCPGHFPDPVRCCSVGRSAGMRQWRGQPIPIFKVARCLRCRWCKYRPPDALAFAFDLDDACPADCRVLTCAVARWCGTVADQSLRVGPARERAHPCIIEAVAVDDHRKRVALVRRGGEDVDLTEAAYWHRCSLRPRHASLRGCLASPCRDHPCLPHTPAFVTPGVRAVAVQFRCTQCTCTPAARSRSRRPARLSTTLPQM